MAEITSLITIASSLKKRAAKQWVVQFNESNFFQQNVKKRLAKESATGREFLIPVLLRRNQSFGGRLEGEDLATPVASEWDELSLSKKYTDARMSITDQAMQASKGNEAAWVNARVYEERALMEEFMTKYSELWYGWGSGAIARINGSPSGTSIVVDDDQASGAGGTFGLKYIRKNMLLSASANLTGYVMERNFHGTVEGTTASTFTITVDDIADAADNDYLFWEASKNRMPTGMMGIIDDGTYVATYGGKTRASAGNEWTISYLDNINGAITENDLILAAHTIEQNIGVVPNLAFTTYGVLRAIAGLFTGDRRYMVQPSKATDIGYTGGYSGVSILLGSTERLNIFTDRKCPKGNLFMPYLKDFLIFHLGDPHWLAMDGESVYRFVANKRAWDCAWVYDCEFFSDRPMSSGRLYGITES